jgi:hypothetical protein
MPPALPPIGEGSPVRVFLGDEAEPFYESATVAGFEPDATGRQPVVLDTPDGTKKCYEDTSRLEPLDVTPATPAGSPQKAEKLPPAKNARACRRATSTTC